MKVLLVDDEQHRFDSIRTAFSAECPIFWMRTGPAGVEALRGDRYDLLLLDHDLYCSSGLTGIEIANEVCRTQDPLKCKIFIHSQNSAGAQRMREILGGFHVTVSPWINEQRTARGLREWFDQACKPVRANEL